MSENAIPPPLWVPEGVAFLWQYLLRHQDRESRSTADARSIGFLAHCLAGFRQSSAQLFQGWRGILAEPLPAWQQSLHANRRARIGHRCVWRRSGVMLEILEVEKSPELTSIRSYAGSDYHSVDRPADGKAFLVESVSLTDLLAQHGAPELIDYIPIDVKRGAIELLLASRQRTAASACLPAAAAREAAPRPSACAIR